VILTVADPNARFLLITIRCRSWICADRTAAGGMIVARSTLDCNEIHLATAKLLPTTSLRLAIGRALRRGESQPQRSQSAPAYANAKAGNCDERKYGGAAHSRFAGQELDLICNHKFV